MNQDELAFADANFDPGDRFRWRVRATGEEFSEPAYGTTLPHWGDPSVPGENLHTEWEQTHAAQFTSDVNEYAYTGGAGRGKRPGPSRGDRRTLLDRPINMFIIGGPATCRSCSPGTSMSQSRFTSRRRT